MLPGKTYTPDDYVRIGVATALVHRHSRCGDRLGDGRRVDVPAEPVPRVDHRS